MGLNVFKKKPSEARRETKTGIEIFKSVLDKKLYYRDVNNKSVPVSEETTITTDASLSGDGTASDPLSVEGKQDTLVSGTNIKTLNGNSILGSGDLAISSGGGAPATQILIEPKSNSSYGIAMDGDAASNLTNLNSGQLLLTAFTPAYDLQIDAISFVTVQTAVAGGLLKLLIYSNANGQPNTKLFESATVSADTTGNKILTGLTFTFNANETYWITTVANDSIQVRAYDTNQQYPLFPIIANSNTTQKYQSYRYNSNFNSLPSTMPNLTSSTYSSSRVAMITLRKS